MTTKYITVAQVVKSLLLVVNLVNRKDYLYRKGKGRCILDTACSYMEKERVSYSLPDSLAMWPPS